MIDIKALFQITYGLYVVCSGDESGGNGFISNTVFQVSSKPPKFAVGCSKNNYSSEVIEKYGNFSISVLHQDTDSEIFGIFGYKCGRDLNKLEGMLLKYGETGVPIVLNDSIAYLECKVVQKVDVGSHWLFVGELLDAQILNETNEPISYAYYRKIKKGSAPRNAPTYVEDQELETNIESDGFGKFKCAACGYIYDEEKEGAKFDNLPEDWKCPVCGAGKEIFFEV